MGGGKGGDTLRAFVALDLDATSIRRIARVSDRLRMGSGAPSATWTPPPKMHITLKFLGQIAVDAVVPLGQSLRDLVDGKPAPPPSAVRLEAFPSVQDARVVVVELVDGENALSKLAAKVEKLARKVGVLEDERPYKPHVTLARLKRPYDARKWLRPELTEGAGLCQVTHLTLYRSELEPEGALHVPLARFAFG
jgi:2'-5' RNA ligase